MRLIVTEILMGMVSGTVSLAFFLIGTMLGALAWYTIERAWPGQFSGQMLI